MIYQSSDCIITFSGELNKDKCKELIQKKKKKKNAFVKRRVEVPELASCTNESQLFSQKKNNYKTTTKLCPNVINNLIKVSISVKKYKFTWVFGFKEKINKEE